MNSSGPRAAKVAMGRVKKTVIEIDAGGHPVFAGHHALYFLEKMLKKLAPAQCFVLGDENTISQCLPEVQAHVPTLQKAELIAIKSGEPSKCLPVCQDIWEHLAELKADRSAVLINLGGGVVSDLGGFIASTYKRGIRSVNLPTSVMGMVDAAIGGKTGIDLKGAKNMVGTFHDPLAVFIYPPFLRTLNKRELLNGLAEMLKHGLIEDAAHWKAITEAPLHDLDALAPLIYRSAAIKAEVVKRDPLEAGFRKVLNFGHTIGHGIEAYSWESQHRALLHGEAIAIGMITESWISARIGVLDREDHDRIASFLIELYKPYLIDGAADHRVVELMKNDKKNKGGEFRFTLIDRIGSAVTDVPVTAKMAGEALEHYRLLVRGRR